MSRREADLVFPRRVTVFAAEGSWALRCPSLIFMLAQAPLALLGACLLGIGGAWLFYGLRDPGSASFLRLLFAVCAPTLLMDLVYLLGRMEVVDALPAPREKAAIAAPALLALPDGGTDAMRPPVPPVRPSLMRWSLPGVLVWGGTALLASAIPLMLVQQDDFDSVLGVKLGGRWFLGTYWNHWWFVFYGLIGTGLLAAVLGFATFVVGLNRRAD